MLPEGGELLHRVGEDPALLARLDTLPGRVDRNVPLAPRTTLRVGGNAAVLFTPRTVDALIEAITTCRSTGVPHLILGAGSNLLFSDRGYAGVVIATRELAGIEPSERTVRVLCGTRLPALLSELDRRAAHALDFLAGIPGSLGGAVTTNAGIPVHAVGDTVETVTVLAADGRLQTIGPQDCGFSYRTSAIRTARLTVVSATLRLDGPSFDGQALLEARRAAQPLAARTAGCVFKNPPGGTAGRLIEEAGLKGLRVGMAKVSELHANFIINLGGARCAEIRKLIDIVRQKVYKSFQISLELEIEVIEG